MGQYLFDFIVVALLVIGITAVLGVLINGIGQRFFGGKNKNVSVSHSLKTQEGWRKVGGRNP
ncbi:hypothetical protein [Metabacillus arenae]|uniref:Uncharacterized protein n=1 Tax=Metabacillus arenae TaxID=2771434 RepID=A0A926RZQ4_9BACI|nr:hypothetical protein [Metabacillus arenae]MBD1383060.1 hypothetical protein [Metabacillus arenae]